MAHIPQEATTAKSRTPRGIRPTRKQKALLIAHRLAPDNWLVVDVNKDNKAIRFYNKHTQNYRTLSFA